MFFNRTCFGNSDDDVLYYILNELKPAKRGFNFFSDLIARLRVCTVKC